MNARLLFSGSQLRNRLSDWSHTYVRHFYALVVVDFERFVYNSWWALDSNGFVRTFTSSELRLLILCYNGGLLIDILLIILERKQVLSISVLFMILSFFIQFDWRQQLFFCEQRVNLFDEF